MSFSRMRADGWKLQKIRFQNKIQKEMSVCFMRMVQPQTELHWASTPPAASASSTKNDLKERLGQQHLEQPLHAARVHSSIWWWPSTLSFPGLQLHYSKRCLCDGMGFSLCLHVTFSPSYKDTSRIGLRPTLMTSLRSHWMLDQLNLITSTKTIFE